MAGSRNRHGRPQGPKIAKHHKKSGVIRPRSKESIVGISPDMLKPRAITGGGLDAERVRLIRDFYARLPEEIFTYQEITKDVEYSFDTGKRRPILSKEVPENRTFIIDNVYFYATPIVGTGLVPAGSVEGAVETYLEIGNVVPVETESERLQSGVAQEKRAYFPFLNDRVGAREVTFSLYAKRGRTVTAYYFNRFATPVPLRTIGVRVEGWMIDSNAFEEILEQQI